MRVAGANRSAFPGAHHHQLWGVGAGQDPEQNPVDPPFIYPIGRSWNSTGPRCPK